MSEKNDGGLAFPSAHFAGQQGMTLRDYFAAKAMQGLIAGTVRKNTMWDLVECADTAYNMADAMLRAGENT